MTSKVQYFESLYAQNDDPWRLRERWYERRKRLLTLAALPRERYRNGFEPGCANGELTALLATRCDALLSTDLNETAVRLTRERLAGARHVRVERRAMPKDWPDVATGGFDLIVVSELGYYLDPADLKRLVTHIGRALAPDGTLLACHWRRPFDEAWQSAAAVHAALDACIGVTRLLHHDDPDVLLDVWSPDGRSVAEREGIT